MTAVVYNGGFIYTSYDYGVTWYQTGTQPTEAAQNNDTYYIIAGVISFLLILAGIYIYFYHYKNKSSSNNTDNSSSGQIQLITSRTDQPYKQLNSALKNEWNIDDDDDDDGGNEEFLYGANETYTKNPLNNLSSSSTSAAIENQLEAKRMFDILEDDEFENDETWNVATEAAVKNKILNKKELAVKITSNKK